MPRLSLWNSGRKANDYNFIDRTISEYFGVGGTAVYVHLYVGPHDQMGATINADTGGVYNPPLPGSSVAPTTPNIRSVQDVLFLENRDRKYSSTVYEIRGIYDVNNVDFDLRQFGLFLQNDTLFIEFHLNDLVAELGRRLIPGDVIELPHQRDDTIPGGSPVLNKFYVVEDANRASDGYSITWWPHIWRCKVAPMPASQEFDDVLTQNVTNPLGFIQGQLSSLLTNIGAEMGIDQAIVDAAITNVPKRFFETQQFWFVPSTTDNNAYTEIPWVFTGGGDAIPPNGAVPIGSGTVFPQSANVGDYYLRTDYQPPALFQWQGTRWVIQEINWRGTEWNVASRLMETFINSNNTTTLNDGTTIPEKQNLSRTIIPRADF